MAKKIKIAFDLDGVIVDKPPLIPKKLLERLFKGFHNKGLHYRFPKSSLEQIIRKISHYYLFRPPIVKNVKFIKEIAKDSKYELYIITGRYSFLANETNIWLDKRDIKKMFKQIFINTDNKQPHLYKEQIIKELRPTIFIDDDCYIIDYLAEKNVQCKFFCFVKKTKECIKSKNIFNLEEIFNENFI